MLVTAMSWYMISEDAKSWVCLHIFTVILHNCPLLKILAQRLGRTGGRTGRGGGRTRGRSGDQGNGEIYGQGGQEGGQVGGRGNEVNDGVDGVPNFSTIIAQQLQNLLRMNVIANNDHSGCTYKEFLACNPKEYDGKGGVIVYTRWIEKMESVQDMSRCENHAIVGAGHAAYTDRFHELARLVPYLVTPKSNRIERYMYGLAPQIRGMVAEIKPKTIQKAVHIAGTLTDEALRNGSIKKNIKKRGNGGEPRKDRNVRDDKKRTRIGNAFATTTNPVGRENTGYFAKDYRVVPRNVNPVNARNPVAARGACYECGITDYYNSVCPRLNRAQGPRGNHPNQALANSGG
ncbi:hypothetical protein Tco_0829124 [Tanacetum coccineum]